MKIVVIAMCLALAMTHPITDFEEVNFSNNILYGAYNGFVKGLYRSSSQNVVDTKCFGTWIESSISSVDNVLDKLFTGSYVPYDSAIEASNNLVNLIYKNTEYCQFGKVLKDINKNCDGDFFEGCFNQTMIDNIKKNLLTLFNPLQNLW